MIPSTIVHLLSGVDITKDYKDTFSFPNASTQATFFLSKSVRTFSDFTYQRKERSVRVPVNAESLWNVNYCMFKNANFGDKWFYAFVTEIKYINESTSDVVLEIDVLQSWWFEKEIKDCYVEREHTSTDNLFEHLVEENLSTGEYINREMSTFTELNAQAIVVASTYDPVAGDVVIGEVYTGIFQGAKFFAFHRTLDGITALKLWLADLVSANKADSVLSIFMMPLALLPTFNDGEAINAETALTVDLSLTANVTDIDGYVPKNKKLFSYPYNLLYITNHNGGVAEYRYEYFLTTLNAFMATCNISTNPVVTLIPKSYKGVLLNYDEFLRMGDFAQCSWTVDSFLAYLADAVVSTPINLAGSVASAASNPAAIPGAILSGASTLASGVKAFRQSDSVKGAVNGGVNTAIGIQTFGIYPKTIRAEYAKMIDDYFHRFGYRVEEMKVPNLTSRQGWNYIKCYDVSIYGNIPQDDLNKIREIFKNGLTIWHTDQVGHYNRDNLPLV